MLATSLEHRLGARIRHLAGLSHRLLRLRFGDVRAIFTQADDATGGWLVVHVARRREVYRGGLDRLTDGLFSPDAWQSVAPEGAECAAVALEPVVDSVQATVLGAFDDRGPMDSVLTLTHGPPGSGKSLVALEAAVTALGEDCRVLVLCPSDRLVSWFLEELGPSGFGVVPEREDPRRVLDGRAQIGVFHKEYFFTTLAGQGRDRQTEFRRWWQRTVDADWRARQILAEHGLDRDERLVDLADALFPVFSVPLRTKDALRDHDEHRLSALLELDRTCGQALSELANRAGVVSRHQAALRAGAALHGADGNLVLVVDEVQDFAPEEWRALTTAAVRWRHAGHVGARMFALGDENQRLTATAFAWRDLEEAAVGEARTLGVEPERMIRRKELPGSYRLRREIAAAARRVLRAPVLDVEARHVSTAEPAVLAPGGEVRLMLCDEAEVLREALARMGPGGAVRVITEAAFEAPNAIGLSVSQAKGLEWDAAVVLWPLGKRGAPVDFDRAARAYTALTRARARLLVVLTPQEWDTLRLAWPEMAPGLPEREWFESLREREELEELVGRMDNLADEAGREGWTEPRVEAILQLAHRVALEGGAELVAERGDSYCRSSEILRRQLQSLREHVGALVLLGDWGAASLVDRRLRASSGVAQASRALRILRGHGPEMGTSELLASAFVQLLDNGSTAEMPVVGGLGPLERRWEDERRRLEEAAEAYVHSLVELHEAKLDRRLDEMEAQLVGAARQLERAGGSPPRELQ